MQERVEWTTEDGETLVGSWFAPEGPAHTALLISAGTAIPRRFYQAFATHAASRGFCALTYDYRGIGDSAPADLSLSKAVFRDWGQHDMPSAIAWVQDRAPGLPLATVGHSAGGQLLGLAHNVSQVAAALFVAVSTGYWRGMPTREKWFTLALWKVVRPLTTAALGYVPGKSLGLGENLPAGVAREWAAWCMEPDYLKAFFDGRRDSPDGRPFGPQHYAEADFPLLAYGFTDDNLATPNNAAPMMALYANAEVETKWIEPSAASAATIGHLGFFRKRLGGPLWDDALLWLRTAATVRPKQGHGSGSTDEADP